MTEARSRVKNNTEKISLQKDLLIVGPLPPPIGGSPLTLLAMIKELEKYPDIRVTVINSSPTRSVHKRMTGFTLEKVKRMMFILRRYLREVQNCDAILIFANDLFAFILVPLLLWIARLRKKATYIKPVGSGLDIFMESHGKIIKSIMLSILKSAQGILSQTQYLTNWLCNEGCNNSYYLPGCRPFTPGELNRPQNDSEFRLIYMAHITRLKGPLVLLDALKMIAEGEGVNLRCDFYGPIHDDILKDFNQAITSIPTAHYMGSVQAGNAIVTISKYDALVLPTCFTTEGHPGVLIEAMLAGVPIITTQIRTLPELVDHGVNGLLVPVGDSSALADAILRLAKDKNLRKRMGEENFKKGVQFRSDVVVARMIDIIFSEGI